MGHIWLSSVVPLVAVLFVIAIEAASRPCVLRSVEFGQVCVCNATYCDNFDDVLTPTKPDQVIVVTTGASGSPFAVTHETILDYDQQIIEFTGTDHIVKSKITVDEKSKFQKIVGFGGSHTGSVTYLLNQLVPSLRDYIYESYYSATDGIAYTMTRVPIGGCDFDVAPWAYNESPENDKALSNFTQLDQRDWDRIEQIRRLQYVSGKPTIKYIGSAWSPPKWIKSNNDWHGASEVLPQFYDTWAEYHVRYLELMKKAGIDYWAITTGNEPQNGNVPFMDFIPFMSLGWTTEHQAKWIAESLGPKLRSSKVSNVKILAGDDQRYTFPWWFQELQAANPKAMDYLYGFAVHYYADKFVSPTLYDQTKHEFTDKVIINTESCEGANDGHSPALGSWVRAQSYILSYIEDLTHSVSGWIDWNLVLDQFGGPNYVQNYVDAPIISNAASGEIYKQPLFYAIGHFSRFVTEDSVRIDVSSTNEMIKSVGFRRPDGHVVLVLYNTYILPIELIVIDGKRKVVLTIHPRTIKSVVYRSLAFN